MSASGHNRTCPTADLASVQLRLARNAIRWERGAANHIQRSSGNCLGKSGRNAVRIRQLVVMATTARRIRRDQGPEEPDAPARLTLRWVLLGREGLRRWPAIR